jgi:DNA-directed RNA polymerase subunit beta'
MLNHFDGIKIALASPEQILNRSYGEVKKPETINYRTLKPEPGGLFCEKIFGPQTDWECKCGKYKRVRYKGIVCDRCGVEITRAKVRRERMGHIILAAPVSHIWYLNDSPNYMGLLLDMSPQVVEIILYFSAYVVIDPGDTGLIKKQLLTEMEFREYRERYDYLFGMGRGFKAEMGAEAIKKLLDDINLEQMAKELRRELKTVSGQEKIHAVRRLEVVEAFRTSGNKPSWMVLDVLPVLPPDLRPMVQLDGGRFATSDLNDLYRRVINRNNRLKRLLDLGAPDIIIRNEKKMLQEAVDALIDNGCLASPVTGPGSRPLKSLSDMLRGKQGRFRLNFEKRVDYSGQSVVTVNPELKLFQCGLPKVMALELFKPFIMRELVDRGYADNIKSAKRMVEKGRPEAWSVIKHAVKERPVLLSSRKITFGRLRIQAFEPVLTEGNTIEISPIVATGFNTTFDGDLITVHLPLYPESQAEARILMLSAHNILNPKNGRPVTTPTQDMVMGCYYLTLEKEGAKGEGKVFSSPEEAIHAFNAGIVDMHARIAVDMSPYLKPFIGHPEMRRRPGRKLLMTTVGKLLFNEIFPEDFPYINSPDFTAPSPLKDFILDRGVDVAAVIRDRPLNETVKKGFLGSIVAQCYRRYGSTRTAEILDEIKKVGFTYATRAGITMAIEDIAIPEKKQQILADAKREVGQIERQFLRGFIAEEERYDRVINVWTKAKDDITVELMDTLDSFNPIYMMAHSGARGIVSQITQLAGMHGLTPSFTGHIPIVANYREGFTANEYFSIAYSVRRDMMNSEYCVQNALKLARRLGDVAHGVIIREHDCGTRQGIIVSEIRDGNEVIEGLYDSIYGRFAMTDILDLGSGTLLVAKNELIDDDIADAIVTCGIYEVYIRSALTCKSRHGVCVKCYGHNLATGRVADVGDAVGIVAAQSIGESITQLYRRNSSTDNILTSINRLKELFEARKPKIPAVIAEFDGRVQTVESRWRREIRITTDYGMAKSYSIPYDTRIRVRDDDYVEAGDELTEGFINPHDLLKVKGPRGVLLYLLKEIQLVFRLKDIDINDKHIEVIIRQMLKRVKIEEAGDTDLLPGSLVDGHLFEKVNYEVEEAGGRPAVARLLLLGITNASLSTDSFLSAASTREAKRVLTDAAVKGKVDPLLGLKENIIIGKLIPVGTGMPNYSRVGVLDDHSYMEAELENGTAEYVGLPSSDIQETSYKVCNMWNSPADDLCHWDEDLYYELGMEISWYEDNSGNVVVGKKPQRTMEWAYGIPKGAFTGALPYSEGLAAVRTIIRVEMYGKKGKRVTHKWGYVDYKGTYIIEPKWDWADSFKDGKARVQLGQLYLIINKKGNVVG